MSQDKTQATPEQVLYAEILRIGMLIGLVMLFITFFVYVFGVASPKIPLDQVHNYWSMPVNEYLEAAEKDYIKMGHLVTGWSWVSLLSSGDFLNFVGIALLAGVTIICYIAIIPVLLKNGDTVYAMIAIAEVIILAGAASGLLEAGH
jgi:hypothetical protein